MLICILYHRCDFCYAKDPDSGGLRPQTTGLGPWTPLRTSIPHTPFMWSPKNSLIN